MKLFNSISNKLVDAYAKELANDLFHLRLPDQASAIKNNVLDKRVEQALAEVFSRAKVFRQQHRLGVFKRARLAKMFQDELVQLGYKKELVSQVTTAFVTVALSGN